MPFIQFVWQRPNIHSLMIRHLKMLLLASPFPFAKCAYLLELVSYTLFSETCRPCRDLAHAQVSNTMCFIQNLSHEKLPRRILGSRTGPTNWARRRIVLDALLSRAFNHRDNVYSGHRLESSSDFAASTLEAPSQHGAVCCSTRAYVAVEVLWTWVI